MIVKHIYCANSLTAVWRLTAIGKYLSIPPSLFDIIMDLSMPLATSCCVYNPLLTCWEDCWCHRFLWHCRQHQQRKFWDDKPLLYEQANPSLPSVKRQPTAWFQSWKRRTLANRCTWFHLPFLQRICSKKQNPKRRNYTPESGLFLVFPCHSNPCEPILHGASSNRCSHFRVYAILRTIRIICQAVGIGFQQSFNLQDLSHFSDGIGILRMSFA